jgi:hypothetical protein
MTWPEIGELTFKGMTAVAAMLGGCAAWRGVRTWRRQLIGQDEYELAKRLIKNLIQLERIIRQMRFPWNDERLTWPEYFKIVDEVRVLLLEAQVQWDDLLNRESAALASCTGELQRCKEERDAVYERPDTPRREEILEATSHILLAQAEGGYDDFFKEVQQAVSALTTKLRPHLRR